MKEGATRGLANPEGRVVVMVVEDDVLIRFPVAEHLRSLGFAVIEAANGSEAIGVLAAVSSIDVVFTDIHMPRPVDGRGVIRWIEENEHRARVILTSGDEAAAAPISAANPDAKVFAKPYRVSEIGDYVSRLVGHDVRHDLDMTSDVPE